MTHAENLLLGMADATILTAQQSVYRFMAAQVRHYGAIRYAGPAFDEKAHRIADAINSMLYDIHWADFDRNEPINIEPKL